RTLDGQHCLWRLRATGHRARRCYRGFDPVHFRGLVGHQLSEHVRLRPHTRHLGVAFGQRGRQRRPSFRARRADTDARAVKALIFGATGMVGDGVLHECLADARVSAVVAVTRSALTISNPKIRELRRSDFFDFSDMKAELASVDACFFCLGDSAVGMNEASYRRVTFDITLAAARALAASHPGATFCYVSGEGVNGSEDRGLMWVRVKSATENAL